MDQAVNQNPVRELLRRREQGREKGIYACCSANEYVIRAAIRRARDRDTVVLVEATANQVNQDGGYTGMKPADFRAFLNRLAAEEGMPQARVFCGGDHLGPLTWRNLPEAEAMPRALELVRGYVLAGFSKIHIDTSMRLADDDPSARLPDETIARRGAELCAAAAHTAAGSDAAAHAIMTTDTVKKELAVETVIGGKTVRMGGIAKGSGMIHPNMGTMLCFLTTDCAISSEMIKSALLETVQVSFNRISVDGDTSTNDTCCVLANGLAGNPVITEKGPDYDAFVEALRALCVELAKKMASDGEGATHLITCTVTGAGSEQSAETVAKSVIGSALTKAAIFGADANWGRVLCAMGYSGEDFNPDKVDVAFQSQAGSVQVCAKGRGLDFDEDLAKRVLTEHDVTIAITMGEGDSSCTCWGCDLTYEYVKINGDYRT